jgi:hypothetical protein
LLNSLSEKQLIIHTKQLLPANFALPNLDVKLNETNEIIINYNPNRIAITDILWQITSQNLDIVDISTKQPDLEQVFQHIVQEK